MAAKYSSWNSKLAINCTWLKSNEPAIILVRSPNSLGKGLLMGASNSFADYKPKYFSRRDKSANCTNFRKIANN